MLRLDDVHWPEDEVSKVKLWHRMAADEIRGKLWKLSETIVTNRGMPHWDEDTEQRIIAATMDNVVRHFTDEAAQIIADREPVSDFGKQCDEHWFGGEGEGTLEEYVRKTDEAQLTPEKDRTKEQHRLVRLVRDSPDLGKIFDGTP